MSAPQFVNNIIDFVDNNKDRERSVQASHAHNVAFGSKLQLRGFLNKCPVCYPVQCKADRPLTANFCISRALGWRAPNGRGGWKADLTGLPREVAANNLRV